MYKQLNAGGGRVSRNADIPAVRFPCRLINYFRSKNAVYEGFFGCPSENQLEYLRAIITTQLDRACGEEVFHFMAVCFLEASNKHPVKGFIIRYILKAKTSFQDLFSTYLTGEIRDLASDGTSDLVRDMVAVYKMSKCMELHISVDALEMAADVLVRFFKFTLQTAYTYFCQKESSPTLKKDIMTHCHEVLRLLLVIIQKYQTDGCEDPKVLDDITKSCIMNILAHKEMSMDTKTLCGIVLLRALVLEIGEKEALKSIFSTEKSLHRHNPHNDIETLVLYSALATKPMLDWMTLIVGDLPAITVVLGHIIKIGERFSSDSAVTLTVARTVYNLSKYLGTFDTVSCDSRAGSSESLDSSSEDDPYDSNGPCDSGPLKSAPNSGPSTSGLHSGPSTSGLHSGPSNSESPSGTSNSGPHSGPSNSGAIDSSPKGPIDEVVNDTDTKDEVPNDKGHIDEGTIHPVPADLMSKDSSPTDIGPIDTSMAELLVVYVQTVIDHSMDSVRYLAGQTLHHIAKFYYECRDYEKLFKIMGNSDQPTKRSYFLIAENVVRHLDEVPRKVVLLIVKNCIYALFAPDLQAAAAVCLESIIKKCIKFYTYYLDVILNMMITHLQERTELENVEAPVLEIYDKVLSIICLHGGPYRAMPILQKVGELEDNASITDSDLIAVLTVMRAIQKLPLPDEQCSPALTTSDYALLQVAAVHPKEQYRILSLSIVIESRKSTKAFIQLDFDFILYFLKYNINAQSSNFRQLTTSLLKKLVKRLADSLSVLLRQNYTGSDLYADFLYTLRYFCFGCLMKGGNTSRRGTALQVIFWLDSLNLPHTRLFSKDDAQRLLACLEDGYDINKELALEILITCPAGLLEECSDFMSLSLEDLLLEASSVKPTDCTSAAYKLLLVQQKFLSSAQKSRSILQLLLSRLQSELSVAQENIVLASAQGPMYGLVHCLRKIMKKQKSNKTREFIDELIITCMAVNKVVACIVNNSSPEGHLPMELEMLAPLTTRTDDEGPKTLVGDSGVTSQMVLLCGWRTVKEVSLLFGELTLSLPIEGEDEGHIEWLISIEQMKAIGYHFITLLSETKHRGAFEQAYVGFTQLAIRLWASKVPELRSLPPKWLKDVIAEISSENNQLCPTRRSAGLPYIIQALVTTELHVNGHGKYFHLSMSWLLRKAIDPNHGANAKTMTLQTKLNQTDSSNPVENPDDTIPEDTEGTENTVIDIALQIEIRTHCLNILRALYRYVSHEIRTHCLNILRALYRNTSLGEAASGWVQDGLMVAIRGLDGDTWQERNSATLLLNSLIVCVFGVQRNKDPEKLSIRNKMTARLFQLRYPAMFEFMMDMLNYSEEKEKDGVLCHSLFGVLLILARLYQSSLEGTDCNFKLSAFVEPVMRRGTSPVLQTRQLVAKAIASIVPVHIWHDQVRVTLSVVSGIHRDANHLHGSLLQLVRLIENAPSLSEVAQATLMVSVCRGLRIVFSSDIDVLGWETRFVIRNLMLKMINQLSWRMKSITIKGKDAIILTADLTKPPIKGAPYYHIYITNLFYYSTIMHLKEVENGATDSYKLTAVRGGISQALQTDTLDDLTAAPYEILLAELNYILIALGKVDEETMCDFQKHINHYLKKPLLRQIAVDYITNRREILDECLSKIITGTTYTECKKKSLMILNAFGYTSKRVVETIMQCVTTSSDEVAMQLINIIEISHDRISALVLESLLNLLTEDECMILDKKTILECLRCICKKSTPNNSEEIRYLIASFLRDNFCNLFDTNMAQHRTSEKFENRALLMCMLMTLLEDDSETIRQSAAQLAVTFTGHPRPLLASAAGMALRQHIACDVSASDERMALMLLMALFDFNSDICETDGKGEQNLVFDKNEQHNVYLEEIIWAQGFAKHILLTYKKRDAADNLKDYLKSLIDNPEYNKAMTTMCGKNLVLYRKFLENESVDKKDVEYWNPKLEFLAQMLLVQGVGN